jgi:spermidine/putrescine-binding protein
MPSVKPLIASLAAALAIASIASTAVAGQFDGVTVRIGTFGGKWRDVVDAHVAKAFEKEGGKIEYVLGQPANNMAKLIAARGQEPPFDILETMDNFLPQLTAGNFVDTIDLSKVPTGSARQIDVRYRQGDDLDHRGGRDLQQGEVCRGGATPAQTLRRPCRPEAEG